MQHIKPMSKGDPLCPLGFHPQVRWPTRCKRCFRDYKEHGNRNREENHELKRGISAVSSPSLTNWNNRSFEDKSSSSIGKRSWISSSNLNADSDCSSKYNENNSSSLTSPWTSTPNLTQLNDSKSKLSDEPVCVTLPRCRPSSTSISSPADDDYRRTSYTVRRRTSSSLVPKSSAEYSATNSIQDSKIQISTSQQSKRNVEDAESRNDNESDIFTDAASTIHSDGSSTLVNTNLSEEQIESLRLELVNLKTRCEKAEKEKNDMLMRRVAYLDSSISTKTTASELSKFQEKIKNLTDSCENLTSEKKALLSRIRQLEAENKSNRSCIVEDEIASLKTKLQAAESLCEELMDENEEMKRELRDMEEEIEEMQDNFRESEVDEYSSIKKELEQTGKNCRILSFKLRKTERKAEQLEAEKLESERKSREAIQKLQKELDDLNEKICSNKIKDARKKAPTLANIPKTSSVEKVSRASLTRGGSQEDPAQLLRDLQDSMEREADLREQLRYAEEEAQNLRKKITRVEEDNESLLLQLKKMATKAKSHRSSPSHLPVNSETSVEKDEGISDDDDPAELKVLLDLSEQESAVLRKRVGELEENCDMLKRKASDLQDKLLSKDSKVIEESRSQKSLKTLENELKDTKSKLLEKENECSRLTAELNSANKKSKTIAKAGSIDGDKDRIDVERQLRIVEQEASVLRTRIYSLESENEKLTAENKQLSIAKLSKKKINQTETDLKSRIAVLEKQLEMKVKAVDPKSADEMKQLKEKCLSLESENAHLITALNFLETENDVELHEQQWKRTPKIVTDTISKTSLKKMVEDLEHEIDLILLSRDKFYSNCLKKIISDQNSKQVLSELEKAKEKLKKSIKECEEEKVKFKEEKRKLTTGEKKNEKLRFEEEKKRLNSEIVSLNSRIKQLDEDSNISRTKLSETSDHLAKLVHELTEKNTLIESLQNQIKKNQIAMKEEEKLKSEIENIRENSKIAKISGMNESKKFEMKIKELNALVEAKNVEIRNKECKIKELENSLTQLSKGNGEPKNPSGNLEKQLSKALQEKETLTLKLKSLKDEKLAEEQAAVAASAALNKEVLTLKDETKNMRISLEAERETSKQYKEEQMKQLLNKDAELKSLKKRLSSIDENRFDELKKGFDTKVDDLKLKLTKKQKEYDELTAKYEQLEEEHVKLKCQSNLQKEQLQSQIGCLQKELTIVQNELRTLRETYNCRQDGWIKEKLTLEEKVKDFEAYKSYDETHKLELNKLKLVLEMKESELEHLQKNKVALMDQMEHMRKENEELSKKLDDFDKVIKIQRNMVAESTSLDIQLRDLKIQLHNEKEGRKVEVAALKLRYENHVATISDELKDVQSQLFRLKHERDTYKHLLEESPKQMDTKSNDATNSVTCQNDFEELKSQISSLEQHISCMEDELSEARIENSRLKTELVSERSAWDVQLSEMTSKINHLEEERLLHSGRTKSVGLKTRMELSWQKEREEQIRLLQETSTLARDLRQTLFEVERERDKERLEMKRRTDQMKKNFDEEQEELKKKLHEFQCDLLELRDAHAKLRTTNEKLRREKENSIRQNLRLNTNEFSSQKIQCILDIIYDLAKLPSSNPDKGLPPVPPKKHIFRDSSFDSKNASRESSLAKEDSQLLLQRLFDLAQQLRESSNHSSREAARKAFISKRPASTESDNTNERSKTVQRRGSLYRKCISLEQTASNNESYEPSIWRGDYDNDGSIISSVTSVHSTEDSHPHKLPHKYDSTFDSRLSGGSTHSEMLMSTLERKKKKGFLGKLKKLAKSSRSMDSDVEALPFNCANQTTPGSNSSIYSNTIPQETVAKKDLKSRITGMFKSSDSRSNSVERSNSLHGNDSSIISDTSKNAITSSQTLPRRTAPSYEKMNKNIFSQSNQSGATMPRLVPPKKK